MVLLDQGVRTVKHLDIFIFHKLRFETVTIKITLLTAFSINAIRTTLNHEIVVHGAEIDFKTPHSHTK